MKLFLLFFCSVISLATCKSKEDKALALIDRHMFKNLYYYTSYEPVETIVDSAFTSIYRDTVIRTEAVRYAAALAVADECLANSKRAIEAGKIYSGHYYFEEIFDGYKKESQDLLNQSKQAMQAAFSADSTINAIASNYPNDFIGWEVRHRFRSKNRDGDYTLGDYVFIIDKEFSSILDNWDMDNEREKEVISYIDKSLSGATRIVSGTLDEGFSSLCNEINKHTQL